jgi:hypothetical protein
MPFGGNQEQRYRISEVLTASMDAASSMSVEAPAAVKKTAGPAGQLGCVHER